MVTLQGISARSAKEYAQGITNISHMDEDRHVGHIFVAYDVSGKAICGAEIDPFSGDGFPDAALRMSAVPNTRFLSQSGPVLGSFGSPVLKTTVIDFDTENWVEVTTPFQQGQPIKITGSAKSLSGDSKNMPIMGLRLLKCRDFQQKAYDILRESLESSDPNPATDAARVAAINSDIEIDRMNLTIMVQWISDASLTQFYSIPEKARVDFDGACCFYFGTDTRHEVARKMFHHMAHPEEA